MHTLYSVGTSAAYFYSALITFLPGFFVGISSQTFFDASVGIMFLGLTGHYLEAIAKGKTSSAIKSLLGLRAVMANVLPADKAAVIKELQSEGKSVSMVGDGINDAPALTQADIGMAIGTGTDVAIEASDITLVSGDLKGVLIAIRLSKITMKNIKQNLFWAFAYNAALIPLGAGVLYPFYGVLLDPIVAAGAMSISTVTVVLNALRLNRFR